MGGALGVSVMGPLLSFRLHAALAGAIQSVFVIALVAAALGLAATAMVPRGRIAQLAVRREEAGARSVPKISP